ncbi:MAG: hypothetical protein ACI909_001218 [Planctomycetota bacterium]|jgi:uncharacterized protein YaiL (DUF2058 family)
MGNSLIDQLKKTGLVDKTKAQTVKHGQYKNKKKKGKKGSAEHLDEAKLLSQQAQAEKVERDRQINLRKKEEAEHKAVAAQIIQLIESNRVEDRDGELVYNFTDANVVKRMFVSETLHKHLSSGRLCIARLGEGYELVPLGVAEKIRQRDPDCIIGEEFVNAVTLDEDDPYADYVIPDDLTW